MKESIVTVKQDGVRTSQKYPLVQHQNNKSVSTTDSQQQNVKASS
jgi:hypothetical protein